MRSKPPKPIEIEDPREAAISELDPKLLKPLDESDFVFIREYLKDFNAARSLRALGYNGNSLYENASRMIRTKKIQDVIAAVKKNLAQKLEWTVANSARDTIMFRDEARQRGQYQAVAKLQEHLDALTGVYNPKLQIDMNVKGSFNLNFNGLKLPDYAKEQIDVTPQNQQLEGDSANDDSESNDREPEA